MSSIHAEMSVWRKHLRRCRLAEKRKLCKACGGTGNCIDMPCSVCKGVGKR